MTGAAVGAVTLAWGCGSSSPSGPPNQTTPPPSGGASAMSAVAGNEQAASIGTPVSSAPAVRVAASNGTPVAGVRVTFTVHDGGGTVTGSPATSNAQGIAQIASWTLGPTPGLNSLIATAPNLEPIFFTATATAGAAANLAIEAGDGQTAVAGSQLPIPPSIKVTDQAGNPVAGIEAVFAVASGGGSLTGGTASTDAAGIAAVGSWTLGPAVGTNTLSATVDGVGVLTFTATGVVGIPASVTGVAGNGQTAPAGSDVAVPPAVRVDDVNGNPVPGIGVTFAVTSGGGAITGASTTTDAAGVAAVGSWTLTAGANTLSATADGVGISGNPVTFTATGTAVVAAYDIEIRYNAGTSPTSAQASAFAQAEARWEGVITADLLDVPVTLGAGSCGMGSPAVNETVDDLVIFVTLKAIDGPGGVLGQAGSCLIRSGSNLPLMGAMEFDTADLAALESSGLLDEVIVHEMGHVLGIGGLWSLFGLLADPAQAGGLDPHFTGTGAIAAFDAAGGTGYTGAKVPVEDSGGPGTVDAHWRESVLDEELMTGFLDAGANPLSAITVRSAADMGYTVDVGQADSFSITIPFRAGPPGPELDLGDDLLRLPILVVEPDGRVTPLRLR